MCQTGCSFSDHFLQTVSVPAAALNSLESSHAAGQAICALCYACATRLTDCLAALMELYSSVQTAGAAAPAGQSAMTEGDVKAVSGLLLRPTQWQSCGPTSPSNAGRPAGAEASATTSDGVLGQRCSLPSEGMCRPRFAEKPPAMGTTQVLGCPGSFIYMCS